MNNQNAQDLAAALARDLAEGDSKDSPLGQAWAKMTDREKALQQVQWIIIALGVP